MGSAAVDEERVPLARLVAFGRMIKFSHSIFAMPFALGAVVLASVDHPLALHQLAWIVVAMVMARTAAMGFNRLVDARIDARNPRTATRELPRGVLSTGEVAALVTASSLGFVLAGGILYSFGVIFHSWRRLRFQNAIWHCFVLLGAACHYTAVFDVVLAS